MMNHHDGAPVLGAPVLGAQCSRAPVNCCSIGILQKSPVQNLTSELWFDRSGSQPHASAGSGSQASNGEKQEGLPPFPFMIPGLEGMLKGMPNPQNLKPGESEEEIVQSQPNGEVCTTTVITEPGGTPRAPRQLA